MEHSPRSGSPSIMVYRFPADAPWPTGYDCGDISTKEGAEKTLLNVCKRW